MMYEREIFMTEDYNKPGMLTFLIILAINLIFFAYLSFVGPGVDDTLINKINKPSNEKVDLNK